MKRVLIYRNPDCAKCARFARMHHLFDWLNRVEDTTAVPATGPLRMGEIAVQDLVSGEILKGADCFRLICKNIPAYWPVLLLFPLPAFRRSIDRELSGCDGDACVLPDASGNGATAQREAGR